LIAFSPKLSYFIGSKWMFNKIHLPVDWTFEYLINQYCFFLLFQFGVDSKSVSINTWTNDSFFSFCSVSVKLFLTSSSAWWFLNVFLFLNVKHFEKWVDFFAHTLVHSSHIPMDVSHRFGGFLERRLWDFF
jgi:hypothetical protein